MEIRPVGKVLINEDCQTEADGHDDANRRF
jgi:hypothetical protein